MLDLESSVEDDGRARPKGQLHALDLIFLRDAPIEKLGMSNSSSEWNVLEHRPIEKLAENLWWVSGAVPRMSLKRTMTIVRLRDGRLVIHNGIALEESAMRDLEAWGKPAFLIVPNGMHRLDAPAYKRRYPEMKVLAPRGSRKKIEALVAVDAMCEEVDLGDDTVRFEALGGIDSVENAMIVRSRDGSTVVLNDVVFNMDRKTDPLGWLITTTFGSAPGPRVSRLAKMLLVKDKKALRADLERFAQLPDLTRLIVAHEKVAHGPEASAALRKAAEYL